MTGRVRLALVVAATLAGLAPVCAEQAAALFVVSVPLGAAVVLDGEPLPARTPLLLRPLAPGKHSVRISREGYPPQLLQVALGAGEIREIRADLAAAFVRLAFPEEQAVAVAGAEQGTAGRLFQLPQGRYGLRREEGTLALDPEYPAEAWIRGLSLTLPLSLAFAAVLTAHDLYYPKRLAVSLGPEVSLSPATLSAYGVSLAVGAFDLALRARRARFRRSFSYAAVPAERSLATAEALYAQAEDFLSRGQLREALRAYASVMEGFPDSLLFAQALFKAARIHFLTGEDDLAIVEFTLLAERYPLPELYDKARRNLADLLLRRRAFEGCLQQLTNMVFLDPQQPREEVAQFAEEVIAAWLADDPLAPPDRIEALRRALAGGA